MKNFTHKKAFTMAEALIVMVILGIIATIMLTTLKPAEFKEKGLEVSAKKVLNEIDSAILHIASDHTQAGELDAVLEEGSFESFSLFEDAPRADSLFKKYLSVTRKILDANENGEIDVADLLEVTRNTNGDDESGIALCLATYFAGYPTLLYVLKDGTEMCVTGVTGVTSTENKWKIAIPGEDQICTVTEALGYIVFDTNGWKQEPNIKGKDIFILPLDKNGIAYDMPCSS